MKYVMLKHQKTGIKAPVFSSNLFCHSDLVPSDDDQWVPTSAGTFSIQTKVCSGESKSLGLKSDPKDSELCLLVIADMEAMLVLAQMEEEK